MRILTITLSLILLAGAALGAPPPGESAKDLALWQRQMAAWIEKGMTAGRSKAALQEAGMLATNAILNMTWQDTEVAEGHLEAAYRQLARDGKRPYTKLDEQFPTSFGNGSYEVGVDIQPGRYRSSGPVGGVFPMCHFARVRTAGAGLMEVDQIIDMQMIQSGQALVTIRPTDGGFRSEGCQPWTIRR